MSVLLRGGTHFTSFLSLESINQLELLHQSVQDFAEVDFFEIGAAKMLDFYFIFLASKPKSAENCKLYVHVCDRTIMEGPIAWKYLCYY